VKENVKELLNGEGGALNGQTVLVTGTLPKLGRKNLVRLIENYGRELLKELRKTTSLVVGDDLGSKK
jgi:NAD-dependent DNA ligase